MQKIRVMLADDHPVARAGVRKFLNKATDIEIVAEAENGIDALELAKTLVPDVLLLDIELPGLKGLDVARELQAVNSPVHILVLSTYDDKQFIFGLLGNGAAGYLTKEEVPETIVEAVRGVARGEKGWVSRRIAAIMSAWTQTDETSGRSLTPREMDVLKWVVKGKTNQEIGMQLGISQKTVEKHLESVFAKLKVTSRVEAAVLAVQEKWV
jgi:two-component system, NarL family, response regulator DegU